MFVCVHVCMQRSEITLRCLPLWLSHLIFETASLTECGTHWSCQSSWSLSPRVVLPLPVNDRIRHVHYPTWLFMWVLGLQTRVLTLAYILPTESSPLSLYKERYSKNRIWEARLIYLSREWSLRTLAMSIYIDLLNHKYVLVKSKNPGHKDASVITSVSPSHCSRLCPAAPCSAT